MIPKGLKASGFAADIAEPKDSGLCGAGERDTAVLWRVVAVAVLILAVMIAVKDGRILRTSGLTGTCSVVKEAAGGGPDINELVGCRAGRLEGRSDLSHRGCKVVGVVKPIEYWRCPAGFDISDAR